MFKDRGLWTWIMHSPVSIMLKLLTFPLHFAEVKIGGVSGSEEGCHMETHQWYFYWCLKM